MKQKSFIFILLVLAAAAVVFFVVSQKAAEVPGRTPTFSQPKSPAIESTSVNDFDTELEQEIKSFDNDSADLTSLDNDSTINNLEKDISDFNL